MSTRRGLVLAAVIALLLLGCAAQKPHPAENPPATSPPPPAAQAPATPAPQSTDEPEETITPEANQRAQVTPSRLDPTEEITPQELATIPDPVPGAPPREKAQDTSGSHRSSRRSPCRKPPAEGACPWDLPSPRWGCCQ
jgi:hypothetical protein